MMHYFLIVHKVLGWSSQVTRVLFDLVDIAKHINIKSCKIYIEGLKVD
jgi:hypothetical protein